MTGTTFSGYVFSALPFDPDMVGEDFPAQIHPYQAGRFPYLTENTAGEVEEVWPYEIIAPPKQKGLSAVSQISFEIPITSPRVVVKRFFPSGQVWECTETHGCEGDDATKFLYANLDSCGGKWTFRVNPGKTSRFYLITEPTGGQFDCNMLAAKVGSILEPIYMALPSYLGDPYEPRLDTTYVQVGPVTLKVLYNAVGESYAVECDPPASCTITEIELSELKLKYSGQEGTVIWLPFDEPIGAEASPGCYYYRTRAGKLKKICP